MLFLRYLFKGLGLIVAMSVIYALLVGPILLWPSPFTAIYSVLAIGVLLGAGMYYIDRIM
jgi:hypothetical protein